MLARRWRKRNPCTLLVGKINWCRHYGKHSGFPQNIKNKLPYGPIIHFCILSEGNEILLSKIYLYLKFIAVLFIIAKIPKQAKQHKLLYTDEMFNGTVINIHIYCI